MSIFHTAILLLSLRETKRENTTAGCPHEQSAVEATLYKKWLLINAYMLCDSKCSWFNGRLRRCGF
jgi:hypothetical protein